MEAIFFLVGEIVALLEGTPCSIKTQEDHTAICREAANLASQLRVISLLSSMQHVLETYSKAFEGRSDIDLYLLELDAQKREINYSGYSRDKIEQALSRYAEVEREHQNKDDVQVVLVFVESLNDLKKAYPSFFLDSTGFIDLIQAQLFNSKHEIHESAPDEKPIENHA